MIYDRIVDTMGLPFALVYAVMLLGLLYNVFVSLPKTFRMKYWPKATGSITSSTLREGKKTSKNGVLIAVYSADIEYTYEVEGDEYSSKKIKWIDHTSNNKKHHQNVLANYPVGQTVEVFFSPKKPSIGVLEPGFGVGNFIALFFFVLGLGSMTMALTRNL